MSERLYKFEIDGKIEFLSIQDAAKLNRKDIFTRIDEIVFNSRNKRMTKDGFESGWQENIQEYVGGRREYDKRLKELGLVELGYDAKPYDTTEYNGLKGNVEFAKEAFDRGLANEQEVDAMISGEYFKDAKCDLSGSSNQTDQAE